RSDRVARALARASLSGVKQNPLHASGMALAPLEVRRAKEVAGRGGCNEAIEDTVHGYRAGRFRPWLRRSRHEVERVPQRPDSGRVHRESARRHVARLFSQLVASLYENEGDCVLRISPEGTFAATITRAKLGTNNLAKAEAFSGTVVSRGNRVTLVTAQGPRLTLMHRGDSLYTVAEDPVVEAPIAMS